MSNINSYHAAVSAFHSAIDFEHSNDNKEAYKKYAEGLTLIGNCLKNDADLCNDTHVANVHSQMLGFAQKSIERLLLILQNAELDHSSDGNSDDENANKKQTQLSAYAELSKTLPQMDASGPTLRINFPGETDDFSSPLTSLEEENRRTVKRYEKRLESIINGAEKASLQLELDRRLAENEALARKRHEEWEKQRKQLADECHQIAQQKFEIHEKMKTGSVKDTDITKQNLYAACLQFNKEHTWAKELDNAINMNAIDDHFLRRTLNFLLQHESYPLGFMLRHVQQKVVHKLTHIIISPPTSQGKNEEMVLKEHFKNVTEDMKKDLFILTTVIQALWEPLSWEANEHIVVDVVHHLYFPSVKPYLIHLSRIFLHSEEEKIKARMEENNNVNLVPYPSSLNPIIGKLHQLSLTHSPTVMMKLLVEILKSFIQMNSNRDGSENLSTLSIGIDDLMPKLIHLILVSNMSTLVSEITFVENFMPAKNALGEEGYAVTLFQSVLSYIQN